LGKYKALPLCSTILIPSLSITARRSIAVLRSTPAPTSRAFHTGRNPETLASAKKALTGVVVPSDSGDLAAAQALVSWVSKSTVQRIGSDNEIKPPRLETFKISNDANFEEKFCHVIGLYLDPPERALVLCCDEKSQCQALERTQCPLPLRKGYGRTQTHDYIRPGTITLFAALSYLEGKIISRTESRISTSSGCGS
jgi:hypothetical protein